MSLRSTLLVESRETLIIITAMIALLHSVALAQNLPLPPIPYDYEALEPHIDAATMRVHHLKHHQTYTDKLNTALAKLRADPDQKHLAKMGIDQLLQHMDEIKDAGIKRGIRNAGGGYVNHDLFFRGMSPDGGADEPESAALKGAIVKTFGSVSSFKQLFAATALEVFGSGWAWLGMCTPRTPLESTHTPGHTTACLC